MRTNGADSSTKPTIIPAEPGWFVVATVRDATSRKPLRRSEETIIAWGVAAERGELPDGTSRCVSEAWPITARLREVRFDDDHWGLKSNHPFGR
jgi:hypothetical protein